MGKLEWHISKLDFCNGISPNGESYNGIYPINPKIDCTSKSEMIGSFSTDVRVPAFVFLKD
jgi:hypothetical protein